MNRRTFISGVAVILVMVPLAADAQPATRIPRIGFLVNTSGPTDPDRAFMQGLTDLGYINGKNIVVDPRYSNGRSELFPEFVADFLRIGVDIIVGWGPPAVVAASRATRDIPIVFIAVADPVGAGFCRDSFATGLQHHGYRPFRRVRSEAPRDP
jgi:putative tryptophan/tyrosine transport system substrate-binding protein